MARVQGLCMLAAGSILHNRFRIERILGRGGMGAVYLATHLELERLVAVKQLRPEGGQLPPGALRQFRLEAQLLHDLRHPNLPGVHDFLEVDGQAYLVMDYIPGRALDDYLLSEGVPSEERVLDWARQLGDVLHYLHTHRPPVIFRDLKPSNVMVTDDGTVKLIDFGIAKLYEAGGVGTQTTVRGHVSRGYAAPEQYAGGTDVLSDVYALGATLFTLLTLEVPPESVDVATGQASPVDVRASRADVTERTALAVEAMMQVDRKRRPASIVAAMEMLGIEAAEVAEGMATRGPTVEAAAAPPRRETSPPPVVTTGREQPRPGRSGTPTDPATGRATAADAAAGHPARGERGGSVHSARAPLDGRPGRPIGPVRETVAAVPGAAPPRRRPVWLALLVALGLVTALAIGRWMHAPAVSPPAPASTGPQASPSVAQASLSAGPHASPSVAQASPSAGPQASPSVGQATPPAGPQASPSVAQATPSAGPLASPSVAQASPSAGPQASPSVAQASPSAGERAPSPVARASPTPRPAATPVVALPPAPRPTLATPPAPPPTRPAPQPATPVAAQPAPYVVPPPRVPSRLPSTLITPGIGVGNLALGTPLDSLRGAGRLVRRNLGGKPVLVSPRFGVGVVPANGEVAMILLTTQAPRGASFATAGGVSLGSDASAVTAELGPSHVERLREGLVEWSYPRRGIAFRFENGRVESILIFRPLR